MINNRSNDSKINSVKKWFLFSACLLLIETLIVASLIALYLWVELNVCPSSFQASGQCYAGWFAWFEWGFYCITLILIYAAALFLSVQFFPSLKNNGIKKLSLCLTATLVVFILVIDFRFIGQMLLAIMVIHGLELYIFSKRSIENIESNK